MGNRILNWIMAKWFIDAVKEIEKTDWLSQILKVCYKQKMVKDNWQKFCEGMERLLVDAESELAQAKKWEV